MAFSSREYLTALLALALLALSAPVTAEDGPKPIPSPPTNRLKPVKVFILAGQSNMEGQGFIKADPRRNGGKGSLEFLVKDPATADRFKHLMGKDGKWVVRDDVWIHFLGRKGKLTVGYGAKEDRIGPELGFGHVIGDAFKEPAAWSPITGIVSPTSLPC